MFDLVLVFGVRAKCEHANFIFYNDRIDFSKDKSCYLLIFHWLGRFSFAWFFVVGI